MTVGRLGSFDFPAGLYLYTGSALNGLEGRINRHLRRDKKLHWHIDYLLGAAEVVEVWWMAGEERWECRWATAIRNRGGSLVVTRFGSSDCRCPAHLLRLADREMLELARQELDAETGNGPLGCWLPGRNGRQWNGTDPLPSSSARAG